MAMEDQAKLLADLTAAISSMNAKLDRLHPVVLELNQYRLGVERAVDAQSASASKPASAAAATSCIDHLNTSQAIPVDTRSSAIAEEGLQPTSVLLLGAQYDLGASATTGATATFAATAVNASITSPPTRSLACSILSTGTSLSTPPPTRKDARKVFVSMSEPFGESQDAAATVKNHKDAHESAILLTIQQLTWYDQLLIPRVPCSLSLRVQMVVRQHRRIINWEPRPAWPPPVQINFSGLSLVGQFATDSTTYWSHQTLDGISSYELQKESGAILHIIFVTVCHVSSIPTQLSSRSSCLNLVCSSFTISFLRTDCWEAYLELNGDCTYFLYLIIQKAWLCLNQHIPLTCWRVVMSSTIARQLWFVLTSVVGHVSFLQHATCRRNPMISLDLEAARNCLWYVRFLLRHVQTENCLTSPWDSGHQVDVSYHQFSRAKQYSSWLTGYFFMGDQKQDFCACSTLHLCQSGFLPSLCSMVMCQLQLEGSCSHCLYLRQIPWPLFSCNQKRPQLIQVEFCPHERLKHGKKIGSVQLLLLSPASNVLVHHRSLLETRSQWKGARKVQGAAPNKVFIDMILCQLQCPKRILAYPACMGMYRSRLSSASGSTFWESKKWELNNGVPYVMDQYTDTTADGIKIGYIWVAEQVREGMHSLAFVSKEECLALMDISYNASQLIMCWERRREASTKMLVHSATSPLVVSSRFNRVNCTFVSAPWDPGDVRVHGVICASRPCVPSCLATGIMGARMDEAISAPAGDAAADQPVNVYVWDMDETLILLKSLLDGSFAGHFEGLKDHEKGTEIGKRWENIILELCDEHFFYEEIENYNEPYLDALREYDDGKDLTKYDFEADCFSSPFDDVNKRKLAYRHRAIGDKYAKGLEKILDHHMVKVWSDLYSSTDKYTDGWLSSAHKLLEEALGKSTAEAAGKPLSINLIVTSGSLVPSIAKCLLYRLDDVISSDNVYSSWEVGKLQCFKWIKERYGGPNVRFCAIGDGHEECSAASIMKWPFVKIEIRPDAPHRFPGLSLSTIHGIMDAVYE